MIDKADKEKEKSGLKKAGLEFSVLALNKAMVWARLFATLFLLVLCIYAVSRREALNNPLYMILFVNLVPYLSAFLIHAVSKKEYELPFEQLAKDYRFSRAAFLGNLVGTLSFAILLILLKGDIFKILLLSYLVVLLGSFLIYRITLYKRMNAV